MNLLATYIHHLDPVVVQLPGTELAIRWYGLAYVAGFVMGYLILRWLAKRDLYCVEEKKLSDFITMIAIFGVLVGGRVGSLLFYWLPREGWDGFVQDPLWVFRVWEGGMASHGGILGVLIAAIIYAKRHQLSSLEVVDGLAIVAPLGIFFGRMANFINGELYGRICEASNPLAMKFPLELHDICLNTPVRWLAMSEKLQYVLPPRPEWIAYTGDYNNWIIALCRDNEAVRELVGECVNPRYPSQLFEGLAEGLLIFIALLALRLLWKSAPRGIFCMLFCFMYAAGRFVTEYYREPDSDAPLWMGLSRGQYLSFGIIALGVIFIIPVAKQIMAEKNKKV